MTGGSSAAPVDFSCNLLEQSKLHVQFLSRLHHLGVTLQPLTVRSFHRYMDVWLPLVHHQHHQQGAPTTPLIPPPDVAWLWHCHRLAPLKYESYVTKRFGCLLEPSPSFAFQSNQEAVASDNKGYDSRPTNNAEVQTQRLWEALHPNEPFFLEELVASNGEPRCSNDAAAALQCIHEEAPVRVLDCDGFNLWGSMQSQSTFLWQISAPEYRDEAFLLDGVDRYRKFLSLSRHVKSSSSSSPPNQPSLPLVPTFQVRALPARHGGLMGSG